MLFYVALDSNEFKERRLDPASKCKETSMSFIKEREYTCSQGMR